jgi:competence protein ComEC
MSRLSSFLSRTPVLPLALCLVAAIVFVVGPRLKQRFDINWPKERITIKAVVVSEPVVKEKVIVVDLLTTQGRHKIKGRLARNPYSEKVKLGDGLQISTYINKVHAWQQGHFDYQRYMACHGFSGELYARQGDWQQQQLSLANLSRLERIRLRFLLWRHRLLDHYRQWGVTDKAYGVVAAMTLGEKSKLDTTLKETYSLVGASHILALSGLHLMIIYTVVTLFVGWRRFRIASQVLIVLSIWAFAFLVGLSPSVVRAAFMISIYALLSLGHRERMSVNTLAFTAIVMLLVNPLSLYDMGFQLSFMAVLAIQLFCPILERIIPLHIQMEHRWLKALWGLTSVSLAAQIGTAPLIAYYFGRFATYFLLSNFVVIPLATLLLYLALLSICTFWWSGLQSLLVVALSYIVILMNHLLEGIAHLPGCSIEGIHLSILQLACIYLLIGSGYVLLSLRSPRFR